MRAFSKIGFFVLIGVVPMAQAQPGVVAGGIVLDRPDPVKDAPYSADAITEISQKMTNPPTVIRTMSRLYRDSQGRERREEALDPETGRSLDPSRPPTVYIYDPVGGANYVLNPLQHSALRIPLPGSRTIGGATMIQPSIQFTPTPGVAGAGAQTPQVVITQGNHVEVTGPAGLRSPSPKPLGVEHLEPATVEGLRAEGTRTTQAVSGSQSDLVIENWTSPELKIQILNRRSDPRGTDMTYRLTRISREEPDPALFQIPDGYEIQEMPTISGGMVTGGVGVGIQPRQ